VRVAWALACALALGCRAPAPTVPPLAKVSPGVDATSTPAEPSVMQPDPPAAQGMAAMDGFLAKGDRRPTVHVVRFDPDALPVATWGDPTAGAGFRVGKIRDGWRLWIRTHVFAEVIVATPPHSGSKVLFTAFTGGSFAQGDVPTCRPGNTQTLMALWYGFSPDGWTDQGVDVEMGDGDLDLATCSATPKRSLHGRAAAIVPGFIYALRVQEGEDDADDKLVVFLPRGAFVSMAADPTMPVDASDTGPFTRLTFPLSPGTARSAVLRVSPASLALWSSLRNTGAPVWSFDDKSAPHDDLQLEVDVSSQDEGKMGTVSLAIPAGRSQRPYAALLAAAKPR